MSSSCWNTHGIIKKKQFKWLDLFVDSIKREKALPSKFDQKKKRFNGNSDISRHKWNQEWYDFIAQNDRIYGAKQILFIVFNQTFKMFMRCLLLKLTMCALLCAQELNEKRNCIPEHATITIGCIERLIRWHNAENMNLKLQVEIWFELQNNSISHAVVSNLPFQQSRELRQTADGGEQIGIARWTNWFGKFTWCQHWAGHW